MAETEQAILNLFDSFWFEKSLFKKNPSSSPPYTQNPDQEIHDQEEPEAEFDELNKLSRMPTLHVRSLSCDQFLSSNTIIGFDSESESPNSVLFLAPKLQTILSGKEVGEFEDPQVKREEEEEEERTEVNVKKTEYGMRRRERRRNGGWGSSKSLSDLEFEELKGFMDMGFVFSEEAHKDSSLVSIIPGLQRLGRTKSGEEDGQVEEDHHGHGAAAAAIDHVVARPYLSEAWDVMDEREKEVNPLMNWRIPAVGNEMDMKDHLRFWAHTVASVASTVR